ncbi:MAG: hypothetical protein QM756_38695 [Polyangiaceae bacterium]
MADVAWPALLDALLQVELLGPSDSGLLSFGAGPEGGIFVQGGRVCWVAARGLQTRLRDLLRAERGMNDAELERVYQRCRSDGRVFGQSLVEEGLIEAQELERALRRHSAECLIRLCDAPKPTLWSSRGERGYAAQFTFEPAELLSDVVSLLLPGAVLAAREEARQLGAAADSTSAFVVDAVRGVAVPVLAPREPFSVESLTALGNWAMSVPLASRELAATPTVILAATAGGEMVWVWWRDSLLFTVFCRDRLNLAAVTAHHLACA